jgi:hypothetical protein
VSGAWADTAVETDGNHSKIAMLWTTDGKGRLEVAAAGCYPLRRVATYEDIDR